MYGLPCPLSCLRVKEGNAAHVQIVESYVNFSNNIHTYIYIYVYQVIQSDLFIP